MRCTADPSKPVWVRCMTKPNLSTALPSCCPRSCTRRRETRTRACGRTSRHRTCDHVLTPEGIRIGGLPPPTAFDFSWMRSGAWSNRFVEELPAGFERSHDALTDHGLKYRSI